VGRQPVRERPRVCGHMAVGGETDGSSGIRSSHSQDGTEVFGTNQGGARLPGTHGRVLAAKGSILRVLRMGYDEIERAIKDLFDRMAKLDREMSDILDDAGDLLEHLREAGVVPEEGCLPPVPRREPGRRSKKKDRDHALLVKQAQAGVANVTIEPLSGGHAKVTIDGGAEVRLSPALTNLMQVLIVDSGDSADGLIGFKSPSEVARLLGKKSSKHVKQQTVRETVRRLRETLSSANYNPYLVQSDRQWGYRFALRRSEDGLIAAKTL
jgi:hypothetical protein